MKIDSLIQALVQKGTANNLIVPADAVYVQNQIMGLLKLTQITPGHSLQSDETIPDILDHLIDYAVSEEIIENVFAEKEILSANIMNCFLSKPSEINERFNQKYAKSPEAATNYFYNLSKNSNYIQLKRISKNIHFKSATPYGEMDITINLSKPEKDPEQIKREKLMKQEKKYPACLLCVENEGYPGHVGHPARANHRIIQVPLGGENWFLQYSPYVYYNEHSIILAEEHRNMVISKSTFERLTEFVQKFPHYFVGSNADLPIVGGSILSHDHYQGGNYEFAMDKAEARFDFSLGGFSTVDASVVKWPMSVIRIQSDERKDLIDAADHILSFWKKYSDTSVNLQAFSNEIPHNTITPIARMKNGKLQLDLVLRNNRTSEAHPYGIFHPHEDVHHIKKENIGLIEVMGLAVLPPRLNDELESVRAALLGKEVDVPEYHEEWTHALRRKHKQTITAENVDAVLQDELGAKFTKVLHDAGVFKESSEGQQGFKRFIDALNKQ
ncbi:UDP-glucose--hexose-1-phosphate uridylyltransferase [Virgibacillus flavescens]|uniref:UDP-glucose--hexose-1-phosphate uridylyltransferase n=1 Tax=Virgibacillus flavescens TaxID=1611422 RepID=UPI003D34EDCB